ncbi:hypothetical protein BCAH1134_C0054 (plasmid) [Bacillus cereus AH1134]|nr:hypothetical protein BCAH1134_C0054 [Bacillus cereus AH1134]
MDLYKTPSFLYISTKRIAFFVLWINFFRLIATCYNPQPFV